MQKLLVIFIQKLNLKPEIIIAHSFGGQVAIYGIGNGIIKANKLILLASAGIREYKQGKKLFIKLIAKSGKLFLVPLPQHIRRKVTRRFYQKIGSDLYLNYNLKETLGNILKEDVSLDAAKINIPTLLIYGSDDNETPPLFGQKFAQLIEYSTLEIIGHAGHFVFIDCQERVLKLVEGFIND
jgi:Predicted hydrolases or acyltransferases (alpha/beta hydrolase superfamily)